MASDYYFMFDSTQNGIQDKLGRRIHKLRVSVSDACQLRCRYCMPENPVFSQSQEFLTFEEIRDTVAVLHRVAGIVAIRITGGEPLLRPNLHILVGYLKALGLTSIGMTTNACLLSKHLSSLAHAGLDNVNISLDTLSESVFFQISRRNGFDSVLQGIESACRAGLRVKLNCVVMRGVNDGEIVNLLEQAFAWGADIRFLEVMNIGVMASQFKEYFVPAKEILAQIGSFYPFNELETDIDSTARQYQTSQGRFGIIASETMPFCNNCSRVRLTATGKLMACLFKEDFRDIRSLIRNKAGDIEFQRELELAIQSKPAERRRATVNAMHIMGG